MGTSRRSKPENRRIPELAIKSPSKISKRKNLLTTYYIIDIGGINIKKQLYRKILALGILLLFSGLMVFPTTGIINKKVDNTVKETYQTLTSSSDTIYKLLVIAPGQFEKELEPLVSHKENMGVSTVLITLDKVYDDMNENGRDEPEKIKYFIKLAIEEWGTEYVLLVGGKKGQLPLWYFPVRYVNMDNDWEPHYISDLYYADIYDSEKQFSSWDSDGDGRYGEWREGEEPEDKNIDMSPDVAVGRLPCRNKLEVKIMVEKIIDYETNAYDKSWFNDMIVVAGDTYLEDQNPKWKGYEGEYYADRALENMTGFNPIKLYTSDETLTGQSDVINAVNQGCGFLYFVGHGNPMTWGNHPPNNEEFIKGLTVQDMYKLKNKHMYPVCVVSGCHNNQFDVSLLKILDKKALYRGEATFECWGWKLTRKIGGGSIATIGCTALGHTKEDKNAFAGGINELEVQFFKQYGQNDVGLLGNTWIAAISWYIDTYPIDWNAPEPDDLNDSWVDAQVAQSWILFGDPSLQIGGYP